ncbi:hypothetical protein HMPREF3188_01499 [Tissierellia bacterium KA00581]|nr:hypothetical protein HMPREF3188_01499 [Tissierellia bacterium KA00581]
MKCEKHFKKIFWRYFMALYDLDPTKLWSLIKPDNTLVLLAILCVIAAVSIYLEQTYSWAGKITGCILALAFTMVLSNFRIIPAYDTVAYDLVWSWVVPIAIPMLLFKADLRKVWKESGKVLGIYLLSGLGTIIGAFIAFFLLQKAIPELYKLSAMMVGTYTGGSMNLVAMSDAFPLTDKTLLGSAVVADNLFMGIYFVSLTIIPTIKFFKKHYSHPYEDEMEKYGTAGENKAAQFWAKKDVSLLDVAKVISISFVIVAISTELGKYISSFKPEGAGFFVELIFGLFGNKYLLLTTITAILATYTNVLAKISGAEEIGTFLIHIFFAVIGAPASIEIILKKAPWLLVFCALIVVINMIITFIFGKIFRFSVEECCIATNANVGGPTTAAALAIARGWNKLVVPAMLVGILGYVIGNYYGLIVGNILKTF